MRSGWVGPGRVIFSEILPHSGKAPDDPGRRHIVWVLIGTAVLRCSVHSVRPATEQEEKLTEFDRAVVQP